MRYADIGSVSHGTMRADDLIPTFAAELDALLKRQPKRFPRKEYRALIREAARISDYDTEDAGYVLEELFDALAAFAPPLCYFGAHDGDGAAYGFWPSDDAISHSFDGLRVSDTSEVPRAYRGEVLHVNDHGNVTLYAANGRGALREVWSCV